jgi:hypothetical protein
MVACDKNEQAMSENNRKTFTSQLKVKVALEAIRRIKFLKEIAQELPRNLLFIRSRLGSGRKH